MACWSGVAAPLGSGRDAGRAEGSGTDDGVVGVVVEGITGCATLGVRWPGESEEGVVRWPVADKPLPASAAACGTEGGRRRRDVRSKGVERSC